MQSPSLEVFKVQLEQPGLPCFEQGVGPEMFRGPFLPEFSCNPVPSDLGSVFSLDTGYLLASTDHVRGLTS